MSAVEERLHPSPGPPGKDSVRRAKPVAADDGVILQVRGLRKVYEVEDEKVVALGKISLQIKKGEICCILGTSGSGKSTLLNIMAGLEKPTRGHVIIAGREVTAMSEKELAVFRRQNIGFIFQSYNLMPQDTALENVAMPLVFKGVSKKEREARAKKMLARVGLKGRMKHRPSQMSGGQQQRVGIARAFISQPPVVFADEPTGNLDSHTTTEVMEMIVRMARRYHETLIIVTHDGDIARYADRIVRLVDGAIVSDTENVSVVPREEPETDAQPAQAPSKRKKPLADSKQGQKQTKG
ncbi:MAG TPA: ABC transporter ATP-binding protein [Candidatus Faecivivens stercorigallinarum]|nr:ABC transporter ATP-binding protein [Candidatus Faecivivens stercorigallinarum]